MKDKDSIVAKNNFDMMLLREMVWRMKGNDAFVVKREKVITALYLTYLVVTLISSLSFDFISEYVWLSDMEFEAGPLCAWLESSQQRNLHHQVESNRARNK